MRKLAWFAGGFAAGALLCAYLLPAAYAWAPGAAAAAAGFVLLLLRVSRARRAAIACLGLGVGLLWCWGYRIAFLRGADELDGATKTTTLFVAADPEPTAYGGKVEVLARESGRTYRALLYLDDAGADLLPGDAVTAEVRFRRCGDSEIGEEQVYDAANGVLFRLSPRSAITVTRPDRLPPRWWPALFSHRLKAAIRAAFPSSTAPFVTALLTGDRSGQSYREGNEMSLIGIRHCIAVSGMHLAILIGAVMLFFRPRRKLCALIGLPLCWFFALAVGMTPSVVRAAVMMSFLLLAPLLKRENDTPTSLLAALFLILLPNPRAIASASLQLSFLAVAGLLLFSGRVYRFLTGWTGRARRPELCRAEAVFRALTAPFAASLAVLPLTLPLSAYYFGMVSVISPVSAALLMPAVTACFAAALAASLLATVSLSAGAVLAVPVSWLARLILGATSLLARVPFAAVYTSNGYMVIFLLCAYAVVWLLILGRGKRPAAAAICCLPAVFAVCLFLASREYRSAPLSVTALNVGQGQSVYFESHGVNALYDCGGNEGNAGETAARFLSSIGRRGLDFLLVSHYDGDHTDGVAQLLSRVRVKELLLPDTADDSGMRGALIAAAKQAGTEVRLIGADTELPFGAGTVTLYAAEPGETGNDASLAARCSADGFDALLTGDLSTAGGKYLLKHHDLSGTEVLVAGHHGARTSTGEALLAEAAPGIVLISVGENSYGHPNPGTIARIQARGAEILRTDRCGNITVRREPDGKENSRE